MAGFTKFVEIRQLDSMLEECSALMAEMNVEPHRYIYESLLEVDPVFAENWWQGVKDFAGNVWQGVKQFAGDVAKGAQTGYNRAADTVAGPVAKFDAVDRALQDLVSVLKRPEFQNFKSASGQGNVAQYLEKVLKDLRSDKKNIPQMQPTQVNQSYGTRQDASKQQKQQQPQSPSQTSNDMINKMNQWQQQQNSPFGPGSKIDRWQQQQAAAAGGGS